MLFETLYRTDPRGKSFDDLRATEYFQPRIDREEIDGKEVCFFRETHGYFDDQQKRSANRTVTFDPEKGSTWAVAEARYEQQLRQWSREGFVHVFYFDPFSPTGMGYRVLDPNAVSMRR